MHQVAQAKPADLVCDVACGGGLVSCAFAPYVASVVGVDMVSTMLDRARALAAERGLRNVTFVTGDATELPFPSGTFSIVVSRYALHHMQSPSAFVSELERVCAPGGLVVLSDVAAHSAPNKAANFNRVEVLRDPSHARFLSSKELIDVVEQAGLHVMRTAPGAISDVLESLLARSFPASDSDRATIRSSFREAISNDVLGIPVQWTSDRQDVKYSYPTLSIAALKPLQ